MNSRLNLRAHCSHSQCKAVPPSLLPWSSGSSEDTASSCCRKPQDLPSAPGPQGCVWLTSPPSSYQSTNTQAHSTVCLALCWNHVRKNKDKNLPILMVLIAWVMRSEQKHVYCSILNHVLSFHNQPNDLFSHVLVKTMIT
jgi:hypothetical protein